VLGARDGMAFQNLPRLVLRGVRRARRDVRVWRRKLVALYSAVEIREGDLPMLYVLILK
jgi:hypothetical protein